MDRLTDGVLNGPNFLMIKTDDPWASIDLGGEKEVAWVRVDIWGSNGFAESKVESGSHSTMVQKD